MGYGFPPEDSYAHYMFAEAAAKREKAKKLQIEMFEISKQRCSEVGAEIHKIFGPSGCEIKCKYRGQVKNGEKRA